MSYKIEVDLDPPLSYKNPTKDLKIAESIHSYVRIEAHAETKEALEWFEEFVNDRIASCSVILKTR